MPAFNPSRLRGLVSSISLIANLIEIGTTFAGALGAAILYFFASAKFGIEVLVVLGSIGLALGFIIGKFLALPIRIQADMIAILLVMEERTRVLEEQPQHNATNMIPQPPTR